MRIKPFDGIVYLADRDGADLPSTAVRDNAGLLGLIQALARTDRAQPPRLCLVTRGAQAVQTDDIVSTAQASLWGQAATIAHEFPGFNCTRIDLSPVPIKTELDLLAQELLHANTDLVALRGDERLLARLERLKLATPDQAVIGTSQPADGRPFGVETTQPGLLDHLVLRSRPRQEPGRGQVEIEVRATGLNFMNVMSALGIYPGYANGCGPLGIECSGVITRLGDGVTGLKPGEPVLALAFDSLGTHALAEADLTQPLPTGLSFEQAATLPIAFLTAHYALHRLGNLQPRERVLIHSASGGVGLAAIQLAQLAGAEIFATAGSDEKRSYLRSLGIPHVMDSRNLDFADEIMRLTQGKGVDIVLNSLAGEAIDKGLSVLAPYGRFLELGKTDIFANNSLGLWQFRKNLSFSAIDLDRMARERPDVLGRIFNEVVGMAAAGSIQPLPLTVFPVEQAVEAFHHMAQARHIGKIVISLTDRDVPILPSKADLAHIKPDATYLITGGLGALGLETSRLAGRSGGTAPGLG